MLALKFLLHSFKYRVLCPVLCRVWPRLWRKSFLRQSSFQPLPLYDLRVRHSMMDYVYYGITRSEKLGFYDA